MPLRHTLYPVPFTLHPARMGSFGAPCLLLLFLLFSLFSPAQKVTKINLVRAESLEYDEQRVNAKRIIGNVCFKHDDTFLYCDSAYFYEDMNVIDAFDNIRIIVNDSLSVYGQKLKYDGNTKIAELHNAVRLVDNQATLLTEHLIYKRNTGTANYYHGGKILDKENTLTSEKGYYFTKRKEFFFKNDVILVNPEYTISSDTLMYNTRSEIAYFYGPTMIESEENTIYCENGWYDTKNDISQFRRNAWFSSKEQKIQGDSLYYNRNSGLGKAMQNVRIIDTVQHIISTGNYAEYNELKHYSLITDSLTAIIIEEKDSLYLHSDTIRVIMDSNQKVKNLYAYYNVRFYRQDLQGKCDSLDYNFTDSVISLYKEPILWTDANQLTSDTIFIKVIDGKIREMHLLNSCFIISTDETDSLEFNQLKGKNMLAFFREGKLRKINVIGNAETLYYLREEDGSLIGINKAISSNMIIFMDEKEIESITFLNKPEGKLYPEKDFPENEKKLKDFIWLDKIRPKNKTDIY